MSFLIYKDTVPPWCLFFMEQGAFRCFSNINKWEVYFMQNYIAFISNVGFPIFIAMFLLIRIESKFEKLVSAFVDLTESINKILEAQGKNHNQ